MKERFMLSYANAVVQKLWILGLLTDAEKNILIKKNIDYYLSN